MDLSTLLAETSRYDDVPLLPPHQEVVFEVAPDNSVNIIPIKEESTFRTLGRRLLGLVRGA
jgi:hypothetical protein